jgi:hypothetical protein
MLVLMLLSISGGVLRRETIEVQRYGKLCL